MEKTIKAKFSNGVIKPLEELVLEEGKELIITISEVPAGAEKTLEALRESFGGWKGLIDAEGLKKNIYEDRLINTRPVPEL
jgi:predicted DNA-binding antitoxin AbrB/MazE fold protein